MTEEEWMTATNSEVAITFLDGTISDRKLRLFGIECCWLCELVCQYTASRSCLETIERYTERAASASEWQSVADAAWEVASQYNLGGIWGPEPGSAEWWETEKEGGAHEAVAYLSTPPTPRMSPGSLLTHAVIKLETFTHFDFEYQFRPLLHDVVGNPFRPVAFAPEWRTDTAVAIAGQMYESRDFGAMPILADALQDAGCDNADVLNHCRGDGPHVRGCWVVDLVLDKS